VVFGETEHLTTTQEDKKAGNFDLIISLGHLVLSYMMSSMGPRPVTST
jgi:hypothetical protein